MTAYDMSPDQPTQRLMGINRLPRLGAVGVNATWDLHADEDGCYQVILGRFNVAGLNCRQVAALSQDALTPLQERAAAGALFGEMNYPELNPNKEPGVTAHRALELREDRLAFQILAIEEWWVDENTASASAADAVPAHQVIVGKIKPHGPFAELLEAQLKLRTDLLCFGCRGFSNLTNETRVYERIVTFDWVPTQDCNPHAVPAPDHADA